MSCLNPITKGEFYDIFVVNEKRSWKCKPGSRTDRLAIFSEFLESEADYVLVDWKKLGYSNAYSCRESFRLGLDYYNMKDHIKLYYNSGILGFRRIREGKESAERLTVMPVLYQPNKLRRDLIGTIQGFLSSEEDCVEVDWYKAYFDSPAQCAGDLRACLRRFQMTNRVRISVKGNIVSLHRK